jgi:hypothetical protein
MYAIGCLPFQRLLDDSFSFFSFSDKNEKFLEFLWLMAREKKTCQRISYHLGTPHHQVI